ISPAPIKPTPMLLIVAPWYNRLRSEPDREERSPTALFLLWLPAAGTHHLSSNLNDLGLRRIQCLCPLVFNNNGTSRPPRSPICCPNTGVKDENHIWNKFGSAVLRYGVKLRQVGTYAMSGTVLHRLIQSIT